jgi:hypothetical protein
LILVSLSGALPMVSISECAEAGTAGDVLVPRPIPHRNALKEFLIGGTTVTKSRAKGT